MKTIKVEDAVGTILGHDLTKIVPGEFKGPAFKKGYMIKDTDIELLKSIGKNHINIIELTENILHENDAAIKIGRWVCGEGVILTEPSEGKIQFKAKCRGVLKINVEALNEINKIGQISLATRHNNILINKNEPLGATRTIPLVIDKYKVDKVEKICKELGKVIKIEPIKSLKVGIIISGTEVFEGRIKDGFAPVLKEKLKFYGSDVLDIKFAPDDKEILEKHIDTFVKNGAEAILITGGMSVDADDVTPNVIEKVCDKIVSYGVPALPGNMLMLGYINKIPVFGLPAATMYFKTTSFDLFFPRVLSGEILTSEDFVEVGHGGFCLQCKECTYPMCSFGK